ncbi:YrbL family protein [Providencia rettgeri]|nr:YrbL family protein [Providencia rettgeri]
MSHYYGFQQTDRGLGYVFQLIKDKTGNVSHTLDYYLKNKQLFLKHKKNMKIAYEQFKKDIYKEAIVTMALKTYNIVYQLGYKPHGKFLIIDNLGSSNFIPMDYFSTRIARATLNRRFSDFEQRLYRDYNIKI